MLTDEPLPVVVRVTDADEPRIGPCQSGLGRRSGGAPENRQLGHRAKISHCTAHSERLGALSGRRSGRIGVGDVDDHRDAVSFGDGLAEAALASHGRELRRRLAGAA
jgi:hypothetical protein